MAADDSSYKSERFSSRHDYTPNDLVHMLVKVITFRHPLGDVKLLLRAGVDIDADVGKGLRAMHYAAYEDYSECIDLLVTYGADVNSVDNSGFTPLHIAAKYGHEASLLRLLENGAIINFVTSKLCRNLQETKALPDCIVNPLTLALDNNNITCAKLLFDQGAYPNTKYFLGHEISLVPPTHHECVELLLDNGAAADSFSRSGLTLLMRASKMKEHETIKLLLKRGADVNKQCPPNFDRKTALHFGVMSADVITCQLLLAAGARTRCPPEYPHSPLEMAICQGSVEIVSLLLASGASANEMTGESISPLQTACTFMNVTNRRDIVELLLHSGANPNYHCHSFSYMGPSLCPLIEYFTYNDKYDLSIVRLLVQHGATVNFRLPTRLLKIKDASGVLAQAHKLRPYNDIMEFMIQAADIYDVDAIVRESSLSDGQKAQLLVAGVNPKPLRHLCRKCIRDRISRSLVTRLEELKLPRYLKDYLRFTVP